MTLLPSPIPHPLDYSPWDLPGWMYDALDWVVGVEWPDGDERAVWDLADQWYAVAAVLAGPHADAVTAAAEVRTGYGGVGAVATAFDGAWRRVAEGDDAPLPVLLTVSTDLARLVEECGCDIEGAKLEVWIELGILVIELVGLAVATVLTAGAASPAAAAAITATRLIVQQIFKRLLAQLARKALKHGLKEAGERAAKEVTKGGVRGLARRAAVGGLYEAGEEAGVTLATQAYQNSTGRRHGLDVAELGTSAAGGLAGGAVAPLAGLGRHATGRGARIGEHVAREMTGEVLAEQAASLATGQGPTSLEDAARAAVSGARGSATTQADAALQGRLDGRLSALAGTSLPPPAIAPPVTIGTDGPSTGGAASGATGVSTEGASGAIAPAPSVLAAGPAEAPVTVGPVEAAAPATAAGSGVPVDSATAAAVSGPVVSSGTGPAEPPQARDASPVADPSRPLDGPPSPRDPSLAGTPTLSSMVNGPSASPGVGGADGPPVAAPAVSTGQSPVTTGPVAQSAAGSLAGPVASVSAGPITAVGTPSHAGPTPPVAAPVAPVVADPVARSGGAAPPLAGPAVPVPTDPVARPGAAAPPVAGPAAPVSGDPVARSGGTAPPLAGPDTRHGTGFAPPLPPTPPPTLRPSDAPLVVGPEALRPRSPEWYAARWAADQEAFERRRYRGHFEHQRNNHEENRRRDRADQLRQAADRAYDEARWLIGESRRLARAGYRAVSERIFAEGRERESWCHRQRDLADAVLAGTRAPGVVAVVGDDFDRINDDVGDLAHGAVGTSDRSALTGDDRPPPIDRTRRYHRRGGLRPPLALHQRDVERRMPRRLDGTVVRTADPRVGGWFGLVNDGGPQADPTRSINCVDCTLSLFDTWVHGRPRVSAPRTFDAYALGDITRPLNGEADGPGRIEDVTGGRFQRLCEPSTEMPPAERARVLDIGYRNLRDQLLVGGHGSFAFVINQWEGGGSHIWVALNQNGTVLYLDPQSGEIADEPLGRHRGAPHPYNAVDVDVLVLAGDGEPLPLAGLRRGLFSQRPDLPAYPPATEHQGYGEPYLNRLHLLASPGSAQPPEPSDDGEPMRAEPGPATRPEDERPAQHQMPAEPTRFGPGTSDVPDADGDGQELSAVLAAVTAGAPTADIDAALRAVAPDLERPAAASLAEVLGEARMRSMFDTIRSEPEQYKPRFAETLLRQLIGSPDLVRILCTTPELLTSLTARPITLHHLADHQQAIAVLGSAVDEIERRGVEAVANDRPSAPRPVHLTAAQWEASRRLAETTQSAVQDGFDVSRRHDEHYRMSYVQQLYGDAQDAQRELNEIATRLAVERGIAGWRTEPKRLDRVLDKLVEYDGDASRLKDLAAAKIEFDNLNDLYATLDRVGRHPDLVVVGIKDRFLKPRGSGYRDVLLNLRMTNGHIAELRLHLTPVDMVAKWEHALYEVRRDLKALAEVHDRPLTAAERAIRGALLRREQEAFWRALGLDESGA
ncbi:toxin glutamine deamidase domain-containing protein [Micromonospora sp. H33]|uniref:toxin glutamine deamidase domain-containing protein n=1 Tax=Micromonospora sp. H33 TaxID=3452215 RepID=UPI003F8CBFFF